MPLNGSGVATPPGANYPAVANTLITATNRNGVDSDIYTILSSALYKDGQQVPTANLPMGGYKLTGLGAGASNGDSVRYEQLTAASAAAIQNTLLTTTGDMIVASAANTPSRLPAAATVAAHATTMDPWVARNVTTSGSAVTFTDIADAPYVGASVLLTMNAAHIWTDGAVFDVQGGATYTTAAGDQVLLVATAVDAFDVTIFPALGQPVSMQPITNSLSGDVALNNTSNYFDGPSVAQGTAGTWFVSGTATVNDAASAGYFAKLWDGTTVIASVAVSLPAGANGAIPLSGYISSPAGNIRISVRDASNTSGSIKADTSGNGKDSTITAIRIG